MSKKFCVIGGHSGAIVSNMKRKWFDTADEGETHARNLITKHYAKNGNKPITLFVVSAEKVVEAGVPTITTRDLAPADLAADTILEDD